MSNKLLNIKNILIIMIYFFPLSILAGPFVINLNLIICSILFLIYLLKNNELKSFFSIELIFLFLFILINILLDLILERPNSYKSIGLLRFLLFGLCINYYFSNNLINRVNYQKYILLILLFVCIDATIQYIFGVNVVGIKKEANYISGFFGDEKILGSYISKIIIFSLPFLIHETNLKKKFLYFFIFLIILLTTERIGLFIFITSTGILFLFSNYSIKKKILVCLIGLSILSTSLILFESLRVNYLYKTLHQFGFENLNKKIILLVNNKTFFSGCDKFKIDSQSCAEQRYDNIKRQLGLQETSTVKNYGIFSQNHIAHILVGIKIWKDNKYFGIGINNFGDASWGNEYELDNKFLNTIKASTHPHNLYIQVLTETGLIGMILFFSSIIIIVLKRLKKIILIKENYLQNLAFLTILVIFMLPIPTGNVFGTSHGVFFWTYLLMNINLKIIKIN